MGNGPNNIIYYEISFMHTSNGYQSLTMSDAIYAVYPKAIVDAIYRKVIKSAHFSSCSPDISPH